MSVQELLNLVISREGEVDKSSCVQCAKLNKRGVKAARSGSPRAARAATEAMRAHWAIGHPDDCRLVCYELPDSRPRVV